MDPVLSVSNHLYVSFSLSFKKKFKKKILATESVVVLYEYIFQKTWVNKNYLQLFIITSISLCVQLN